MPLAVTCSASIDRTTTRSAKGCRFTNSPDLALVFIECQETDTALCGI